MREPVRIKTPLTREALSALRMGDTVLLTGELLTGRDAAHKRIVSALEAGAALPFELRGQAIYYVGPCPAPPGHVIGACGPTTSGRMDVYAPALLRAGLMAMIGKGQRGAAVIEAMKQAGAVYFAATGGAGALLARCVKRCDVIAFPDLGAEAVHRLEVRDLPLIVAIDAQGNDLFVEGPKKFAAK